MGGAGATEAPRVRPRRRRGHAARRRLAVDARGAGRGGERDRAGDAASTRPGFPSTVAAAVPDAIRAGRIGRSIGAGRCSRAPPTRPGARPPSTLPAARIGVFVGAESGRSSFATVVALARAAGGGDTFDRARVRRGARGAGAAIEPHVVSPAAVTSALARRLGAAGPASTVSLACASSAAAIAEAARAIRAGECDVAVCGGVGADVDPLDARRLRHAGRALARAAVSCPFDARRDGFVVGEGAAVVVLAAERGAAPRSSSRARRARSTPIT